MRHKARYSGGKFVLLLLLCRHIGLLFGKRLDTNLPCNRIRKYPDSPVHTLSDSLRIYFFHPGDPESGFKNFRIRCRIRPTGVEAGSRFWKEKVEDLKISGYTCGRGL